MPPEDSTVIAEIDRLLSDFQADREANPGAISGWRVRLATAIQRLAPPNSYYVEEAEIAFPQVDTKAV